MAVTPLQVWSERRPAVYAALELVPSRPREIAWRLYWHVWLRLKYWSFYPVTNPRMTRLAITLAVAGYIAWRRQHAL